MQYPNINAERARNGMTLEQLASTLGVTRKTIYNWISKGDIPQGKLVQMANLFDCSIDYLLGQQTERNTLTERIDSNE